MTNETDEQLPSIAEEPSEHLSSEVSSANIMTNYESKRGQFCDVCAQMVLTIRSSSGAAVQTYNPNGYQVVPVKPANIVYLQGMGRNFFICFNHAKELVAKFFSG